MQRLMAPALTMHVRDLNRPTGRSHWLGWIQVLMLIVWCMLATPAEATLTQAEVGYVMYNGRAMAIGGSYSYTRADAEAMMIARHQSPLSTIQGTMWVTDLNAPNTGEVFQLCVRGVGPNNPECPGGPWPGYGTVYNYNCTPKSYCDVIDSEVFILKYSVMPSHGDDGNHRHEKAFA